MTPQTCATSLTLASWSSRAMRESCRLDGTAIVDEAGCSAERSVSFSTALVTSSMNSGTPSVLLTI